MTTSKKQNLSLIGFGIAIIIFIILVIYPLFTGIQKESDSLISQKKELLELETKTKNLKSFQRSSQGYLADFEKIEELLINPSEPINFIEFLEREAKEASLSIEILPFPLGKEENQLPSMNFRLIIKGPFSNFLKFLEKLESALYLIDTLNLNATKRDEEMEISLLIKVYTK